MAELAERGLEIRLVAHPVLAAMRDRQTGALVGRPAEAHGKGGELRESFIHIHVERVDDAERRAEIVAGAGCRCWPRCGSACRTGGRWSRASTASSPSCKDNPPTVPVDDIAEAIQFLEWLVADNFTLLGVRDYTLAGQGRDLAPVRDSGLGLLRGDDVPVLTRGGKVVTITPQLRAFFDEPKNADRHQGQRQVARAPPHLSRLHRRQALRRRRQPDRRVPHRRPVHLDGLYRARPAPFLTCAARSTRCCGAPASIRTAIPARRWSTCWRTIRATSCSRSTRTRSTSSRWSSSSSRSVRACACWRGATASTASCRCWSTCRASATTAACAAAIGEYLAEAFKGHVSAFYPFFPEGPLTRVHFIIGRSGGETPNPDRATLEEAVGDDRAHLDRRAGAGAGRGARAGARRARCSSATATRSREGYREAYSPLDAVADIHVIEGLSRGAAARRRLLPPRRGRQALRRA